MGHVAAFVRQRAPIAVRPSRYDEVSALLDWIVAAVERRDHRVLAAALRMRPPLADAHRLAAAEQLVLQRLREETRRAPAPDLATEGIDDDEFVRLTVREGDLDVLPALVGDVEGELHLLSVELHVQLRHERARAIAVRMRRPLLNDRCGGGEARGGRGLGMGARTARKCERASAQECDGNAGRRKR